MGLLLRGIADLALDYVSACRRIRRPWPTVAAGSLALAMILASAAVVSIARSTAASGAVRQGGINVEPSMRPWRYSGANPQSWWCVPPNCTSDFSNPSSMIQHEINVAKTVGAANIRLEVPWALVEPQRGIYDWTRSDLIMTAAKSTGITIEPVLVWSPSWAAAAPNQPPQPADMQQFAHDYAARYDRDIPVIEIWNEPDSGHYLYNGSAQTYVTDMLNPAYTGIKSVDPSIKVELGGPANDAGTCCPFLSAVIGDGGNFDIAAYHNYVGTGLSEAAAYARITSRPIWMGEYGVQSASGDQSAAITNGLTGTAPLAMAQWYNLRDTGAWNCCPPSLAGSATWGLLNADFSAKQSYTTMQMLLGGSSPSPSPSPSATPSPSAMPSPSPSPAPSPSASPSPTPMPSATPSQSPTPSPSPSPSPGSGSTIFFDNFASDANGSPPTGWTSSGVNATWTVQSSNTRFVSHTGWTGHLTTGSAAWSNYMVSASVLPSCWGSEVDRVLFGVQDSGRYSVDIVGGTRIILTRTAGTVSAQLASAAFTCNPSYWHTVSIRWTRDGTITVSVDGSQLLSVLDSSHTSGAIGIESNDPFAFTNVLVQAAT